MLTEFIYLKNIPQAVQFTRLMLKFSGRTELICEDIVIDAKSLLSVIGLAVGRSMRLSVNTEDADDMIYELSAFQGNQR